MKYRVLCYGDSNTWGCVPIESMDSIERFEQHQRWPGVVESYLGENFCIIEEGNPGRTIACSDILEEGKNGIDTIVPILDSHQPLNLAIIMLGTNDIKQRFNLGASDIARSTIRLVTVIQRHSLYVGSPPKIVIVIPPPITTPAIFLEDEFLNSQDKSINLSTHLIPMLEQLNIDYIDAGTIIGPSPIDGIHLDAKSHKVLGKHIAEFIKNTVN